MALVVAVRELKELVPAVKQHPWIAFHCANGVYGLAYGYANCDWSKQPLVVERLLCGAVMGAMHANPYQSWWTTYWHLAATECRLRGRSDDEVKEYQPFRCILETPSMSEMDRRREEKAENKRKISS